MSEFSSEISTMSVSGDWDWSSGVVNDNFVLTRNQIVTGASTVAGVIIAYYQITLTQAQGIGLALVGGTTLLPDQVLYTYYGTTEKFYKEVKLGGQFAYYRTKIVVKIYHDAAHTRLIGVSERILESPSPMSIEPEFELS